MRKLIGLVFLFAVLALASLPPANAVFYPYCDSGYCATASPLAKCLCPTWTDRPNAVVVCGNWNRVGGCWYE